MSHYVKVETQFRDPQALLHALAQLGFGEGQVEVHTEPQALYGFQGDVRPERAHIILRRAHVGRVSNDIGFVRGEDGTYQAIISEYDQKSRYGATWQGKLTQEYGIVKAQQQAARQGLQTQVIRREDGVVRLVARGYR
jgi:uncharacterized protein YukE